RPSSYQTLRFMLVRWEPKSRRVGGRKPCRASSTVSKNSRLTPRTLTPGRQEVAGQWVAHVLPASAEQTRPPPAGEASTRSWPIDVSDVAPLTNAEPSTTGIHVLPPSWVAYTPPLLTPLASVFNSETYNVPSGSSVTLSMSPLPGSVTALKEPPPSLERK